MWQRGPSWRQYARFLGADPHADVWDVWWLVATEGMVPVLLGLVAGIGGALLMGRLIASLLFGEQPYDLLTMGGVTALIGLTAAIACAILAARATRLDPAVVGRAE